MAEERAIVVGAGGISRVWLNALKAEKVNVAAVVDIDKSAAEGRIAEFALKAAASDDLAKTLRTARADIVLDLTTPEAHCSVTCAALKAGFHVIGEKPMASSMAQARKMVRTAEQTGKMYMVSQSRRWDAKHEMARRMTYSKKIGDVTTVNCDFYAGPHFGGFREQMPSPLILDMSIHHFDLARYMTGLDPVAVYAREYNPRGSWYAGDAAVSCIFEMTDGVIFTYRASWCGEGCDTSWNGSWRIVGTRGTIVYENDEDPCGQVVAGKTGFRRPMRDIKAPASRMKYTEFRGALREMLAYLRKGKTPQTECHDNIKSLAMVFSVIESSRKGKRVPVRVM